MTKDEFIAKVVLLGFKPDFIAKNTTVYCFSKQSIKVDLYTQPQNRIHVHIYAKKLNDYRHSHTLESALTKLITIL